ncbi:hypothetical protein AB0L56_27355 [Streptomyces sp. NPDC052079]|uniref:hypothetical protein n=1 Tax=Streptomyces sp. NPDC052079 TaxID=3155526 RepID=UPI0034165FB3
MSWKLRMDVVIEAAFDALPDDVRERLALALADACSDPYASTTPFGEDDGVMRLLVLPDVMAVLLVSSALGTVRVVQIDH